MPTASHRPTPTGKGGASAASNETPVSTKEQPNPPADPNTPASRSPELAANQKKDRRRALHPTLPTRQTVAIIRPSPSMITHTRS